MWKYIVIWTLFSIFTEPLPSFIDDYGIEHKDNTTTLNSKSTIHQKEFLNKVDALNFIHNTPQGPMDYVQNAKLDSVFIEVKK